ncbi:hypothetical protein [Deinococcus sp.]|uniref:hypothetical protein n=1 Tax=Deinococcus sp. TaxID=47478 RepID=UPI0025C27CC3|nr:hypothetical protein [Deinococcus sp.]
MIPRLLLGLLLTTPASAQTSRFHPATTTSTVSMPSLKAGEVLVIPTLTQILPRVDPHFIVKVTPAEVQITLPQSGRRIFLSLSSGQGRIEDLRMGSATITFQARRSGDQLTVPATDLANALGLSSLAQGSTPDGYTQAVQTQAKLALDRRRSLSLPRTFLPGDQARQTSEQFAYLFPQRQSGEFILMDPEQHFAQAFTVTGGVARQTWAASLGQPWPTAASRLLAYLGRPVQEEGQRPDWRSGVDEFLISDSVGTIYIHTATITPQGQERFQRTYVQEQLEERAFPIVP